MKKSIALALTVATLAFAGAVSSVSAQTIASTSPVSAAADASAHAPKAHFWTRWNQERKSDTRKANECVGPASFCSVYFG